MKMNKSTPYIIQMAAIFPLSTANMPNNCFSFNANTANPHIYKATKYPFSCFLWLLIARKN